MIRRASIKNALLLLTVAFCLPAQERQVDPTYLHRFVPGLSEKAVDLTTPTCHYKPIFGEGDPGSMILRGIARFGEVVVDPGGSSAQVIYAAEEQVDRKSVV